MTLSNIAKRINPEPNGGHPCPDRKTWSLTGCNKCDGAQKVSIMDNGFDEHTIEISCLMCGKLDFHQAAPAATHAATPEQPGRRPRSLSAAGVPSLPIKLISPIRAESKPATDARRYNHPKPPQQEPPSMRNEDPEMIEMLYRGKQIPMAHAIGTVATAALGYALAKSINPFYGYCYICWVAGGDMEKKPKKPPAFACELCGFARPQSATRCRPCRKNPNRVQEIEAAEAAEQERRKAAACDVLPNLPGTMATQR